MSWQEDYVWRYYTSRPGFINGTEEFWKMCGSYAPRPATILEVGAGPSNATSRFLSQLGDVHGVDVDSEVAKNTYLKSAHLIDPRSTYPFPDEYFDMCVSDYVVEHIAEPENHLREVARVLRPGGAYVLRTPNRWHYVTVVARMTPTWFHKLVANRLRRLSGEAHDPYPTRYLMNSQFAIRRLAMTAGLSVAAVRMIEREPSYGMASRALFVAFTLYERAVNSTELLANCRVNILAALRKDFGQ